jgi:hypothetical protein
MKRFGRRSNEPGPVSAADLQAAADELGDLYESSLRDPEGRIRVEDLLTAAAAVCGEACIAAAGEFNLEDHQFTPGSAVLSDRINGILCADASDWPSASNSVFGIIYRGAVEGGYDASSFPRVADVFRSYVASLGGGGEDAVERWGFVGLSVAEDHWPQIAPLRLAYELRKPAREILQARQVPQPGWPGVCASAIVRELVRVRTAIDPSTAVSIVLETTNGMAKIAPMTERHLRESSG